MKFAVIVGVFHRLRPRVLTAGQLRPPAGRIPGGRMLACRRWGQRQTGYYYLSIPSGVLSLRANDLRFGAVPHLFALLLGRHEKSPQEYCHPLRINRHCGNESALGNFRARVA